MSKYKKKEEGMLEGEEEEREEDGEEEILAINYENTLKINHPCIT